MKLLYISVESGTDRPQLYWLDFLLFLLRKILLVRSQKRRKRGERRGKKEGRKEGKGRKKEGKKGGNRGGKRENKRGKMIERKREEGLLEHKRYRLISN